MCLANLRCRHPRPRLIVLEGTTRVTIFRRHADRLSPHRERDKKESAMKQICYTHYDSPMGKMLLAADERGLRLISFASGKSKFFS